MVRSATAQPRKRRYVARMFLWLLAPLLRYSQSREAYVLRLIGNRQGPVLKPDRRRDRGAYQGADRRSGAAAR